MIMSSLGVKGKIPRGFRIWVISLYWYPNTGINLAGGNTFSVA